MNATLERMQRDRGHFYNWYDTRTLEPLPPRFLSTVDSGNLAASSDRDAAGLPRRSESAPDRRRTRSPDCAIICSACCAPSPIPARTPSILRSAESLRRQLASEPDDFFFWEGVLTESHSVIEALCDAADWTARRFDDRSPAVAVEIRYWSNLLKARIAAALDSLGELVPWIHQPFETELRMTLRNPQLSGLMEKLRTVPKLSQMGALYDEIEAAVDTLNPATLSGSPFRIHEATFDVLR